MAESAGGPADSYIGSLISLTSKSEIRYEGLLYTVDTENSNIALQNVRSFGTEGRKKNGPQILASDKVYEFIIFRGTDIKDLQVKMSPPPSIHNDPAIISVQDQPSQPVSAPSAYVPLVADLTGNANSTSYTASAVPYYHSANSGVTLWAPPPPPLGPSGNMPVNWQGFYRPPDERQPLNHLPLPPPAAAALAAAGTVPTPEPAPAQVPSAHLGPEQPSSQPLIASIFAHSPPSHIPLRKELDRLGGTSTISVVDPARPMFSAHPTVLGLKTPLPVSNSLSSSSSAPNADSCDPIHETSSAGVQPSKSLVKQFDEVKVQPHLEVRSRVGSSGVSSGIGLPLVAPATQAVRKVSSASRKGPVTHKQVYKQVQGARDPPKSGHRLAVLKSQPPSAQPLLPLPVCPIQHKAVIQVHDWVFNSNPMRRGGGRGSGMGRAGRGVHSRSKLLEDFDFIAMNEKFKKEEVWDELLKVEAKERVGEGGDATRGFMDGGVEKEADKAFDRSLSEISRRSVYVKDDFFDSLSCDALDQEHGRSERRKFSEQRKVDTETFGSFHLKYHRGRHGAYGGRGLGRGVGRGRGQGQGRGNSFRYYSSSRGEGRAGPVG